MYAQLYPDWRVSQRRAVEAVCSGEGIHVWVADAGSGVVGFVAVRFDHDESIGEIYMLAVDPVDQGKGVGATLTSFALHWIKDNGLALAMVETGGDPGHAPARRIYEQAGFTKLPITRYFKKL